MQNLAPEIVTSNYGLRNRLIGLLDYNPESGEFVRKVSRGNSGVGATAGNPDKDGYLVLEVDGRKHKAHRLAWLFYYGKWPNGEIDHKNRMKSDNRINNLREATKPQNQANAKPRGDSLKGASFHKRIQKWQSQISHNCKKLCLGYFDTEQEAHGAYMVAAIALKGEFARAK